MYLPYSAFLRQFAEIQVCIISLMLENIIFLLNLTNPSLKYVEKRENFQKMFFVTQYYTPV